MSALPGRFAWGLQLQIKGIVRSVWPPGSVGWRRVRGEAGCSHRQSRMLAANKVIFFVVGGVGWNREKKMELSLQSF